MRKALAVTGITTVVLAGALGGAAVAGGGPANDVAGGGEGVQRAIGGVQAPNARIAAFISQGGTVERSKGLNGVTHPSLGAYCLDPKDATFDRNKAVPSVSVDWSTSLGDALMAQWRSSGIGCPAGSLGVLTFDGEDGSFDLSNNVSFTVVVP